MAGPVLLRNQWSTVNASFSTLRSPSPEAVQHHTGGDGPGQDLVGYLRALERGEMERGDGLIALAYHWLVVNDGPHKGTRVEVRPWSKQGGATLHHNELSRAVVLTGDFTHEHPTDTAMDSLAETWADGMHGGFIVADPAIIQPHKLYYPTACPGDNLLAALPELRTRVANHLHPPALIDWDVVIAFEAWKRRRAGKRIVRAHALPRGPLHKGDRGPDVITLNDLLVYKHLLLRSGHAFGLRTASAVRHGKRLAGYPKAEQDGNVVGPRFAAWLLKP